MKSSEIACIKNQLFCTDCMVHRTNYHLFIIEKMYYTYNLVTVTCHKMHKHQVYTCMCLPLCWYQHTLSSNSVSRTGNQKKFFMIAGKFTECPLQIKKFFLYNSFNEEIVNSVLSNNLSINFSREYSVHYLSMDLPHDISL